MLIPRQTKQFETLDRSQRFHRSREVYEKKQLSLDFDENVGYSEKIMLLNLNRLFDQRGGEEAKKKGAPK